MADLYSKASIILTPNAFSASKVYAVKPSNGTGDFTSSRSGNATRVNTSGILEFMGNNVTRLDYSPTGSVCPVLLLEPGSTNSLRYSNSFDTLWQLNATTLTASAAISPDGTNNAWKLNETAGSTTTYDVRQTGSFTATAGTRYIFSAYVKPAERNQVAFQTNTGGSYDFTRYNLTGTGSVYQSTIQPGHTASISLLPNGWYRITDAVTADASVAKYFSINLQSSSINTSPNDSYLGKSNTAGIYIYGAQIETLSTFTNAYETTASSYIPTTTIPTTRNPDIVNNFGMQSAVYVNSKTWTLLVDFDINYTNTGAFNGGSFFYVNDSTGTLWYLVKTPTGIRGLDQKANPTQAIFNPIACPNASKIALVSNGTSINVYLNGTNQNITYTPPTSSMLSIDRLYMQPSDPILGNPMTAKFKKIIVFPTALTSAECIALTT